MSVVWLSLMSAKSAAISADFLTERASVGSPAAIEADLNLVSAKNTEIVNAAGIVFFC